MGLTGTPEGFEPSFELLKADLIQLRSQQNTLFTHADIVVGPNRVDLAVRELKEAATRGDRVIVVSCNDAIEVIRIKQALDEDLLGRVRVVLDMDSGRLGVIDPELGEPILAKDYRDLEKYAKENQGPHIFLCQGLYDAANIAPSKDAEGIPFDGKATFILANITSLVNAIQASQRLGVTVEAAVDRMPGKMVYLIAYEDARLLTSEVSKLKNAKSAEEARDIVFSISSRMLLEANQSNIAMVMRPSGGADAKGVNARLRRTGRKLGRRFGFGRADTKGATQRLRELGQQLGLNVRTLLQ